MIHLENIEKYYVNGSGYLHALKNINIRVCQGELVSIVGASGSGKSTLLNILGILDRFSSGEYLYKGTEVKHLTEFKAAKFRNFHIGFVFQSFNLIEYYTALENVALPLFYQGISGKYRLSKAKTILSSVGLFDKLNYFPQELSGGEKQRVAIARAIITNPDLILADEPTGALDSNIARGIIDLLIKLNQQGQTVIIVTHNTEIAKLTKRIVTLSDGYIINDTTNYCK